MVARIYDADSEALSDDGFVEDAFQSRFGKGCVGVFHPVSFPPEGGTIVKAGPYFDQGEDQPRKGSCIAKVGLWMVDATTQAVRLLPASYRFHRYSKRAPGEL